MQKNPGLEISVFIMEKQREKKSGKCIEKNSNYVYNGYYFVTICTKNIIRCFIETKNGIIELFYNRKKSRKIITGNAQSYSWHIDY